jgi:predicted  nucleic acid-binding Zn-ribbon protein
VSPEDPIDRLERDVRGLTTSYGAVEREATRHDEQIKGQANDIAALQADFKAASAQFVQALSDVDRHCEERTQRIEGLLKEQSKELKKEIAIEHAQQAAQRWTMKDRVVVYAALIAAVGGALTAVVGK